MRQTGQVQTLEPRRLLSGAFASVSAHGTLSVVGTAKNDAITISLKNQQVVAHLNGMSLAFPGTIVQRIFANGLGGNDRIVNNTALPSTLLGSGGNDTVRGGSGNDSLD